MIARRMVGAWIDDEHAYDVNNNDVEYMGTLFWSERVRKRFIKNIKKKSENDILTMIIIIIPVPVHIYIEYISSFTIITSIFILYYMPNEIEFIYI